MGKYIIDNGVEYKLVRTFKNENDADVFVEELATKVKSKRFRPIIKKMHYYFANNSWFSRFFNFNRFKVYVPSKIKIDIDSNTKKIKHAGDIAKHIHNNLMDQL